MNKFVGLNPAIALNNKWHITFCGALKRGEAVKGFARSGDRLLTVVFGL